MKSWSPQFIPHNFLRHIGAHRLFQLRAMIGLLCASVGVMLLGAWWIHRQTLGQLASVRELSGRRQTVRFERETLPSIARHEIKLIQSAGSIRAITRFRDSYFAATEGGLVKMTRTGKITQRYNLHDGLPESDLVSLASFNDQLFIGTRTQGLVAFDGDRFTRFRWPDRQPQAIAALLVDQRRLLIGTFAAGLLDFDGREFTELKVGAEKKRLTAINCLVKAGNRLFVGTFADGLWLEEAGRWLHFTTDDGLLSNRITGIEVSDGQVVVAADFGLAAAPAEMLMTETASLPQHRFRALATLPALSGLVKFRERLFACKDDGEVFLLAEHASNRAQLREIAWQRPLRLAGCRLAVFDGSLWLTGSEGLWRTEAAEPSAASSAHLALAPFSHVNDATMPSDNLISALAFDDHGRLWAGSFRGGIDLINPAGQRLTHLESETTREINHLVWNAETKQMMAATSSGVLLFDAGLRRQRISKADGLLSNSVAHIALMPATAFSPAKAAPQRHSGMLFATSRGLSLGELGRLRGLTTVQGLPSNNLYTALSLGDRLFVGTLSGLAMIEGGRVVQVFKDSNSKLTHNWITGLCRSDQRIFIGTYGGGVFELTAAGDLASFAADIGRVVVNPNAMFSDSERLYVGTLDGAWVCSLRSQKWIHLKAELPAATVLSIMCDDRHAYFGTTSGIARIEIGWLKSMAESQ